MDKTVRSIVNDYLQLHGYDGLFYPGECACLLDDLMPCGGDSIPHCEPGYRTECPEECGEHDFHIAPTKDEE